MKPERLYKKWTHNDKTSAFRLIDVWVGTAVRGFVVFCLQEERKRIRDWILLCQTEEDLKEFDKEFPIDEARE